jgi:hypothetical protein
MQQSMRDNAAARRTLTRAVRADEYNQDFGGGSVNALKLNSALLLMLVQCHALAQAGETAPPAAAADQAVTAVHVAGMRDPAWKPYRYMLNGVAAFEEKHALAPTAPLRFVLQRWRPDVSMEGLSLTLSAENVDIPIPLAADNTFVLPVDEQAKNAGAELQLNRKMGSVHWFPYIRSAGLKPGQRRLGDLRLECETIWAIDYETIPFAARNMIRAFGGPCGWSKGRFSFHEAQPIVSATLVSGERRLALPVSASAYEYTPPLHDKSWNDESVVELAFAPAAEPEAAPNSVPVPAAN